MIYTKLMHRIRVIAIALSIFLILPLSTSADTPSTNSGQVTAQERTALISQLVQKVLELQQKIVALGGTPIACTLTKTLSLGTRGEEVRCLQRYLIAQGFLKADLATGFDGLTPSGYFGPLTKAAVIALQWRNNLEPIGYVGRITRSLLNTAPSISARPFMISTTATSTAPTLPSYPPAPFPAPTCSPMEPETRTLACPVGQPGFITQTRISLCPSDATSPAWSEWQTTSNSCVVATTPTPAPVPKSTLRILSISNPTAVHISKPADLPAYTESPPWIIAGGWRGYFLSTGHAYFCASPDSLTGLSITLQSQYCALVSNATTSRDWERNYSGVMSAYALHPNTPNAIILQAIHGENKNEIVGTTTIQFGFFGTTSLQNTINTDIKVSDCADLYDSNGIYQNCWSAYNGFVSMAHMPFTEAAGWGLSAPVTDSGPIVWPRSGYLSADGTKASQGVRHPTFFVSGNYLYVFYLDMSYGSTWGSIKVARAALSDLPSPSAFRAYGNDGFLQPALPAGFNAADIRSFYRVKGPASDCIVGCADDSFRFSVASIKDSNRFLGVLEYWDRTNKKARVSLTTSSDLMHWSDPVVVQEAEAWSSITLHYPIFMDEAGWTNTTVDPKGFYLLGTDTHANTMVLKASIEIVE